MVTTLVCPFQDIFVGFRSHDGVLQSTQSISTLDIPRLVRGKGSHSWDAGLVLEFAERFLLFLRDELLRTTSDASDVWRITFTPRTGIRIHKLHSDAEIAEVSNGEDRVGFLPREFYESRRF